MIRRPGIQEWWERDGKSDLKIYGTSLALALLVRSVAVEPRFIPSLSMYPTFEIGDQLAVDKLSKKLSRPYQRKDVVVFYPPPKFSEFSNRGKGDVSKRQREKTLSTNWKQGLRGASAPHARVASV